jgi:hypothetical protein
MSIGGSKATSSLTRSSPRHNSRAGARDCLVPQLEILRDRAFDGPVLVVGAFSPPGCNRAAVRESWNCVPD